MSLALVLPALGLEHVLHTDPAALLAMPVYQVFHWLGDSLLALPVGALAVWLGFRLADRLGLSPTTYGGRVNRAAIITLLFAVLLVPGVALHDETDALTHANLVDAPHAHAPLSTSPAAAPLDGLPIFIAHALADGLEGQLLALPAVVLALNWRATSPR